MQTPAGRKKKGKARDGGEAREFKLERTVRKANLSEFSEVKENLAYWLSRPPEERVAAVCHLRRMHAGNRTRLQRTARVVQRARG